MEKLINVFDRNRLTGTFRFVDTWFESQKSWHSLTPGIVLSSDSNVGSGMYMNAGYDIVCYLRYVSPEVEDAEAEYTPFLRLKDVRPDRQGHLITRPFGVANWLVSQRLTTFAFPEFLRWEAIT
jgi:hypothetical protein